MEYFIERDAIVCTELTKVKMPERLVDNTANTWQKNRGQTEATRDARQGKTAEVVFYEYLHSLEECKKSFDYQAYDDIRKDKFKNNAPCDGILWRKNSEKENDVAFLFDQIAEWSTSLEQRGEQDGHLPKALRIKLRQNEMYLVEIKSTNVRKNLSEGAKDTGDIIQRIKSRDDYLTYPSLIRTSEKDWSFNEYVQYAESQGLSFAQLIESEHLSNSDIIVRIYVDGPEGDNRRAYIIGYAHIDVRISA